MNEEKIENETSNLGVFVNPGVSPWVKMAFGTSILVIAVVCGVFAMYMKDIALDGWQGMILYFFAGLAWLAMLTQIPKWYKMHKAQMAIWVQEYMDSLEVTE